jgi:hypothetical protein
VLVEGGGRPKESIKKHEVAKEEDLSKLPNVSRVGSCLLLSEIVVRVVF